MADVELVIKIPEEKYNYAKSQVAEGITNPWKVCIANGTLLPKGHGRLIDADEIQFENSEFDTYSDYSRAFDAIDEAETIIEADRRKNSGKNAL